GVEFKMFFISFIPRSHESTLFPYTTLFRSRHRFAADMGGGRVAALRVAGGAAEVVALENGTPVRSLYRASEGESVSGIAASGERDRKSTRLNSSHRTISYAVFCLKKKKNYF